MKKETPSLVSKFIGQILLAFVWCIFFGIAYGLNKVEKTKVPNAIIIPSVICLGLNILSTISKFGLFENTAASLKRSMMNRPSQIKKRKESNKKEVVEFTVEDLRKQRKDTDWLPIILMSSIYLLLIIVGNFVF